MPRGVRSEFDPKRRPLGKPRPTPFFELNDNAARVAADWAAGAGSELYRFSSSGTPSEGAIKEVDFNLNRGDIHPREKERLKNLRKHLEVKLEEDA